MGVAPRTMVVSMRMLVFVVVRMVVVVIVVFRRCHGYGNRTVYVLGVPPSTGTSRSAKYSGAVTL